MKRTVKLYNVIFPLWLVALFPAAWLAMLPANFIVDSLVLLAAAGAMGLPGKGRLWRKSILRIWLLGFVADIVGMLTLLAVLVAAWMAGSARVGPPWVETLAEGLLNNCFVHPVSFAVMTLAVLLAALLIYRFDRHVFCSVLEDGRQARGLAAAMAVCTAPWLFYVPTAVWAPLLRLLGAAA